MTKLSRKPIDPERFGHYVNNLWSAFTLLGSKEEIRLLFKDLFTHTEYKMFAKRLEIARRLLRGERYEDIERELSVTTHTISRVNNILNEKGEGLRRANEVLDKLEEKFLAQQRERTKNLENPFRAKVKRKTLGGALAKVGVEWADRAIINKLKERSARKSLPA
jgi:TrpR-related protein YerC/YecD